MNSITDALCNLTENYPNFEGSTKAKRGVYGTIFCYKEILREIKLQARQSALHAFLAI
jgi:hypothetical protein